MNNQENNKQHHGGKKRPYYNNKKHYNNNRKPNGESENATPAAPIEAVDEATVALDISHEETSDNTPKVVVEISNEPPKYVTVAGVRFKANGKVYYFDKGNFNLKDGCHVIVDTARGPEFGEVAFAEKSIPESSLVPPLRSVVRLATEEDLRHHEDNKRREAEAFDVCLEKIPKHGLDMKLVEAQYTFDNSKLLFYFTSPGRVDFRELVKDPAAVFKTRIELRQIGIRDEAKLLGGLGACGRPLCCSTFLSDFGQVTIKMAKEQSLSLNTGKISGCCGRLMCCLQFEYATYAEETAKTPPVDAVVKTPDGVGTVTEISPLAGNVKVRLRDNPDVMPKIYKRDDVKIISMPPKSDDN